MTEPYTVLPLLTVGPVTAPKEANNHCSAAPVIQRLRQSKTHGSTNGQVGRR